jgi:hypothetical protein
VTIGPREPEIPTVDVVPAAKAFPLRKFAFANKSNVQAIIMRTRLFDNFIGTFTRIVKIDFGKRCSKSKKSGST